MKRSSCGDGHCLAGDHFAVTCTVNLQKPSAKRRIVNLRNVRAIDVQELKRDISSSCLSHILTHSSTTADILQVYNSVLTDLMDKQDYMNHTSLLIVEIIPPKQHFSKSKVTFHQQLIVV